MSRDRLFDTSRHKNVSSSSRITRELERWLPWSRVSAMIIARHDLDWLAPAAQYPRRIFRVTHHSPVSVGISPRPIQTRANTASYSSSRCRTQKSNIFIPGAANSVPTPTAATIGALRVAVYQIVFLVGSRDIPHLPFSVVKRGWARTCCVLPVLVGGERWFRLILPLLSVPLNEANCEGSPQDFSSACVAHPLQDPIHQNHSTIL